MRTLNFLRTNAWGLAAMLLVGLTFLILVYIGKTPEIIHNHLLTTNPAIKYGFRVLIFLPALSIMFTSAWRQQRWPDKLLLLALSLQVMALFCWINAMLNYGIFLGMATITASVTNGLKVYKPPLAFYFIIAYLLFSLLSIIWYETPPPMHFIKHYYYWLTIIALFLLIKLSNNQLEEILKVLFHVGLLFVAVSLCVWLYEAHSFQHPISEWFWLPGRSKFSIGSDVPFTYIYSWTNYQHPSFVATGICLALTTGFWLCGRKRIGFIELIAMAIGTALLIDLTMSRVGIIIYLIALGLGTGYLLRKSRRVLIGYAALITIGIGFTIPICNLSSLKVDHNDSARIEMLKQGLSLIKAHPLKGNGLESTLYNDEWTIQHLHLHNQFINDWAQSGIIRVLALLGIFLSAIYNAIRKRSFLIPALLLTYLPVMLIDTPFYTGYMIPFFFIPLTLALVATDCPQVVWECKKLNTQRKLP